MKTTDDVFWAVVIIGTVGVIQLGLIIFAVVRMARRVVERGDALTIGDAIAQATRAKKK